MEDKYFVYKWNNIKREQGSFFVHKDSLLFSSHYALVQKNKKKLSQIFSLLLLLPVFCTLFNFTFLNLLSLSQYTKDKE